MKELDLRCKECDRFLNIKETSSMIAKVRCPNSKCKAINKVKIVNSDSPLKDIRFKFANGR